MLRCTVGASSSHSEDACRTKLPGRSLSMCRLCGSRRLVASSRGHLTRGGLKLGSNLRRVTVNESSAGNSTTEDKDEKIKQTMADLDAILGIEEEEEEEQNETEPSTKLNAAVEAEIVKVAEDVVEQVAKDQGDDAKKKLSDGMMKVIEAANNLAEGKGDEKTLREKVEDLIGSVGLPQDSVPSEDIKLIKDKAFGATSFWVTETEPGWTSKDGTIIRGNFRADPEKVFDELEKTVKELFGDKYEVFLISEASADPDDFTPRNSFKIVPAVSARPEETQNWQVIVAGVLVFLTIGSSFELGLLANFGKLPKDYIEYLAHADEYVGDALPPIVTEWDPVPFIISCLPVTAGVVALQFIHELGHKIAGFIRKIELGPSYFLPNTQLGTFGTITQLKSLARNKRDLWDVAFGGIFLGGAASLAMMIWGLLLGQDPATSKDILVPIPSNLLQGSLLLGGLVKLSVGQAATQQQDVLLHPLTIAGWCGLTTTALNLLPVGTLDGGRMVYSAYDQRTLTVTSIFTYAGLGLGLLGSSLSLPFGLYVLICQREPEANLKNQVTNAGSQRQTVTAVAVLIAILILLPLSPFAPDAAMPNGGILM